MDINWSASDYKLKPSPESDFDLRWTMRKLLAPGSWRSGASWASTSIPKLVRQRIVRGRCCTYYGKAFDIKRHWIWHQLRYPTRRSDHASYHGYTSNSNHKSYWYRSLVENLICMPSNTLTDIEKFNISLPMQQPSTRPSFYGGATILVSKL